MGVVILVRRTVPPRGSPPASLGPEQSGSLPPASSRSLPAESACRTLAGAPGTPLQTRLGFSESLTPTSPQTALYGLARGLCGGSGSRLRRIEVREGEHRLPSDPSGRRDVLALD